MAVFAVIDDSKVTNVVEAEEKIILELMFPESTIVEQSAETGPAHIGGDVLSGKFRAVSPYASWVFNEETWLWEAPIPYPDFEQFYLWNEETQEWILQATEPAITDLPAV